MEKFLSKYAKILVVLATILGALSGPLGKAISAPSLAIGFWRLTMGLPFFIISVFSSKYRRGELKNIDKKSLAGAMTAGFFLFVFFRTLCFAPAGVSVHPDRRTAAEEQRVDLNRADSAELRQLPGIGPVLSEAIISWREEHGGFRTVEELQNVPGIGEKTLAGLRDYVYVGGLSTDEDPGR